MIDMILQHYLVKSTYTNVKDFEEYFRILLDDFEALGKTICSQIIHPRVLMYPNKSLENTSFRWTNTRRNE